MTREYMQSLTMRGLAEGEHRISEVAKTTFVINRVIFTSDLPCEVSLIVGNEIMLNWVLGSLLNKELSFIEQRQIVRAGIPIAMCVRSNNKLEYASCLLMGPFSDEWGRSRSVHACPRNAAFTAKVLQEPETDDETAWESPTWDSD